MDSTENFTSVNDSTLQCNQEQTHKIFTFVIYVCVFGPICVLGLIGNVLSFLVLQRDPKSQAARFLLQVLAVVDNVFLISAGVCLLYTATLLYYTREQADNLHWFFPYMKASIWPLVHVTQLMTVYVTVLVAFNRYYAICHPFSSDRLHGFRAVKMQTALTLLFAAIYCLPRFLEFHYISPAGNNDINFSSNSSISDVSNSTQDINANVRHFYGIIYEQVLYCVFVFLGPFLLICWFNFQVIVALKCPSAEVVAGLTLTRAERRERRNITYVMILIVVVFLVTQTPAFINQILYSILDYDCANSTYYYYYHICNVVAASNSSLNFIIYCAYRRHFRIRLRYLLTRTYRRITQISYYTPSSTRRTGDVDRTSEPDQNVEMTLLRRPSDVPYIDQTLCTFEEMIETTNIQYCLDAQRNVA